MIWRFILFSFVLDVDYQDMLGKDRSLPSAFDVTVEFPLIVTKQEYY
jgi:hypothetical protein